MYQKNTSNFIHDKLIDIKIYPFYKMGWRGLVDRQSESYSIQHDFCLKSGNVDDYKIINKILNNNKLDSNDGIIIGYNGGEVYRIGISTRTDGNNIDYFCFELDDCLIHDDLNLANQYVQKSIHDIYPDLEIFMEKYNLVGQTYQGFEFDINIYRFSDVTIGFVIKINNNIYTYGPIPKNILDSGNNQNIKEYLLSNLK